MQTKPLIRAAVAADARAMNAYVAEIFATSDWLISSPAEARMSWWRRRWWLALKAARPLEVCLVAERDGRMVGMAECFTDARARTRHVATVAMSVAKDHRGQGVGRALLAGLIKWAEGNGTTEKLQLHVHAPNKAAIALYKSNGFIEEGTRHGAIKHADSQYIDDILMGRWLTKP